MTEHLKIRAMVKEFPFLGQFDLTNCAGVVIKRADERVMESVPFQLTLTSEVATIEQGVQATLFNQNGECIGMATPSTYSIDHTNGGAECDTIGESLLEAAFRVGSKLVYYIVWLEYYRACVSRHCTRTVRVVIYKPHNDLTIDEIVEKAWSLAQAHAAMLCNVT